MGTKTASTNFWSYKSYITERRTRVMIWAEDDELARTQRVVCLPTDNSYGRQRRTIQGTESSGHLEIHEDDCLTWPQRVPLPAKASEREQRTTQGDRVQLMSRNTQSRRPCSSSSGHIHTSSLVSSPTKTAEREQRTTQPSRIQQTSRDTRRLPFSCQRRLWKESNGSCT